MLSVGGYDLAKLTIFFDIGGWFSKINIFLILGEM